MVESLKQNAVAEVIPLNRLGLGNRKAVYTSEVSLKLLEHSLMAGAGPSITLECLQGKATPLDCILGGNICAETSVTIALCLGS